LLTGASSEVVIGCKLSSWDDQLLRYRFFLIVPP